MAYAVTRRRGSPFDPDARSSVAWGCAPVGNDRIEAVLGLIDGKPSRLKQRILKSNGITSRRYALNEYAYTELCRRRRRT